MDHQQKLQLCRISLVVLVFALFTGDLSVAVVVEIVDFKVSNKIKSPFRSPTLLVSESIHLHHGFKLTSLTMARSAWAQPGSGHLHSTGATPLESPEEAMCRSTHIHQSQPQSQQHWRLRSSRTRGPPQPTIWKRDPNIQTQGCQSTASCSPAPARFCCESDVESSLERLICS